jgi:drug/metabolite transporter (DMT)-like permease
MNKIGPISWLLFIALCLIWGSSFVLMMQSLVTFNAYEVAALRMLGGGIVLLPLAIKAFKTVTKKQIITTILSGFLGTAFPAILFCLAETKVDSSFAGMLNSTTPIFILIVGTLFFGLKIEKLKWLGIFIGLAGSIILMAAYFQKKFIDPNYSVGNIYYALLVTLATIFYGINVNMVGKNLQNVSSNNIATIALTSLIPFALGILLFTGFFSKYNFTQTKVQQAIGYAIFLGAVGTALASILFYVLVKRAGYVFAGLVTYGIPFVAIAWGIYLFNDYVSLMQLIGLIVILAGVFIANLTIKKVNKN